MLRDIEVENGGSAPRIYSMDDYFMIEVEKVRSCYYFYFTRRTLHLDLLFHFTVYLVN